MRNRFVALGVMTLSLVALPAAGDEGRIPVFASPTVIDAPGKYFVTMNLATAAGSLITITSNNVDLDLNGFTLTSTASAPVITATGVEGVTIRNGTITGGSNNVLVGSSQRVVIEDVQAVAASGDGIRLENSTQFVVRRALVRGSGLLGIQVGGPSVGGPPMVGTIADSVIEDCRAGIRVEKFPAGSPFASVAIQNNRLRDIAVTGMAFREGGACVISHNTLEQIGNDGMTLTTSRCRIEHNAIVGAASRGIYLEGSDNFVLGNLVSGASSTGLQISGNRNQIEGNVLNGNASHGLFIFGTSNVYRRNTARGNGGAGAACSPDASIAAGNSSAGDNFLPGPPTLPGCV